MFRSINITETSQGDGAMAGTPCCPLQLTVGPFLPPYLVLPSSSKLGAPRLCLFSQVFQGLLELGTGDSSTIKKALGGCSLNPPAADFNRAADSWPPCFSHTRLSGRGSSSSHRLLPCLPPTGQWAPSWSVPRPWWSKGWCLDAGWLWWSRMGTWAASRDLPSGPTYIHLLGLISASGRCYDVYLVMHLKKVWEKKSLNYFPSKSGV